MSQLNLHNFEPRNPPPQRNATDVPIVHKLAESYKLWHGFFVRLPRLTRYTLGTKIDNLFTDCLELSLLAGYTQHNEKQAVIQKLSATFDSLKFFLKLLWEMKAIENQKYISLSTPLAEIGKMIGGWLNMSK